MLSHPMIADRALGRGQLYGRSARALSLPALTLTETRYAAGELLPRHTHETANFCLVINGSFDEVVGRTDRFCRDGQLLYRAAGESHSQRFLGAGCRCFTIEGADTAADGVPHRQARATAQHRGHAVVSATRLFDEFRRPFPVDSLRLEELSGELLASVANTGGHRERHRPAWIDTVCDAIHDRYDEAISINGLAADVGVHRVHLSRTFRRFMGCGIGAYLRRVRVHAACTALTDDAGTLSTIAARTGFSDQSHMTRAFREVMGSTPSGYLRPAERPPTP